jgi:ribosomal protein L35
MYNFHQNQSLSSWRVPFILKLSKKYIQHKRFSTHIDKKKQKKHIKQLEGATMLAGYNIQNLSSLEVEPQDTMKRAARIIYYFCRQIEDIEKEKHLLCRNKRKSNTCSGM